MFRKLFIILFFLTIPSVNAHMQHAHVEGYNIQISHAPMELQPGIPTTFLINIELAGKQVNDLDVSFVISQLGEEAATIKAMEEDVYKAHYTFPKGGEYSARISFSHKGRDINAHFIIPVTGQSNQLLGGGVISKGFFLQGTLLLIASLLLSLFFVSGVMGRIPKRDYKIDAFRFTPFKKAMKSRSLLNVVQATSLVIYLLIILVGLIGSQVGGTNITTVAVWSIWWTGVIIVILFFGKFWCTLCPWHTATTWMKRRNLSLNKKWPAKLNNIYPAIGLLAVVTWFEVGFSLTHVPKYTSYLLILLLGISMVSAAVFKRRAFCMHMCFIGAIQGIYSSMSPLELRSKNKGTCKKCSTKDCIRGNEKGDPCPVLVYAGGMKRNNRCILCNECIKTCPHDNLAMNIRPPASELWGIEHHNIPEATFVVALLGLTLFPSAMMFSSWTRFKMTVSDQTFFLIITALTIGSIAIPAIITYSSSWASRTLSGVKTHSVKDIFKVFGYSLIPLTLFYHLAHNLMHIIMEGPLAFRVISDPLGRGWNLFGTRDNLMMSATHHTPIKDIQSSLILIGLFISNIVAFKMSQKLYRDEKRALRGFLPMSLLLLLIALLALDFLSQPMNMSTM
jgi:polyferredoxin